MVILLADDLGPYEVSAYGVEHISTPNIDQIGAEAGAAWTVRVEDHELVWDEGSR